MKTKYLHLLLFAILVIFTNNELMAQKYMSGKVSGFNNYPLNGATVTTKKSKKTVTTDAQGNYKIEIAAKDKIEFSANGFYSYVFKYAGEETLNVNLIYENTKKAFKEVVDNEHMTEANLNEAIEKYSDQNNFFDSYSNIYDLIQSECAGILVDDMSSPPRITLTGRSDGGTVLLVVNKAITFDISYIIPGEVKSVKLLKGTDATMMYGNRGANGVLEIDLKR